MSPHGLLEAPGETAAAPAPDAAAVLKVTEWLIREARFLPDNAALLGQFCEQMTAIGLPLDRVSLHLRALHPRYRGVSRVWRPGQPITERFMDHGIEKTAMYLESPVREVTEAGHRLDWRLDRSGLLPFAVLDELHDEGFTHYVIAPLVYAAVGLVSAFAVATRQPGGFTPAEMDVFDELLPAYAAVVEAKSLARFVENMLNTYVGHEPTRLILDGQVRRGDIRTITAALMLVDLRDFTLLSDGLPPRAVIHLLNDYFDCIFPAVNTHGGEILEIMGDGILAIFHPAPDDDGQSCREALVAAQESLAAVERYNERALPGAPVMRIGIALHYGTVSYGNIGSGDRLDFTVIGPDVNLTSRIEHFCRELERPLITSEAFAERVERPMWELGHFELRGFSRRHRLFAPMMDDEIDAIPRDAA